MPRIVPFALSLLLAACGGGVESPPADDSAPRAVASSPPSGPVADHRAAPAPTTLRTFADWTAGCDNGGRCQAGALMTDDAPAPPVLVSIRRDAGPGAAISIRFQIDGEAPAPLPLTLIVDDQPIARGGTKAGEFVEMTGGPAATLAAALAGGRVLTIRGAADEAVGSVSLRGAAAALRWIDAQQGRADTAGAIVARGTRADTRPAPALPAIRAATIRGEAALLDPQLVATMRRTAACDDRDLPEVETKPLGGGRTLAIVPCRMGAYNLIAAVFVVEGGKATPAAFDAPSVMESDAPGVQTIVNGGFADGVLTSDGKGRGLGDCGVAQRFAWDGTRFRLFQQDEMGECRGNIDFIRTWTAEVVR